ncbi:hypothetical protein RIF29_17695 [Crotalaria pallida]|uniref:RRM domain-containing protein n=1 Tax=Crotalaria pallida TaxID=3830 RepID=A0AAN9FPI3_CROPI
MVSPSRNLSGGGGKNTTVVIEDDKECMEQVRGGDDGIIEEKDDDEDDDDDEVTRRRKRRRVVRQDYVALQQSGAGGGGGGKNNTTVDDGNDNRSKEMVKDCVGHDSKCFCISLRQLVEGRRKETGNPNLSEEDVLEEIRDYNNKSIERINNNIPHEKINRPAIPWITSTEEAECYLAAKRSRSHPVFRCIVTGLVQTIDAKDLVEAFSPFGVIVKIKRLTALMVNGDLLEGTSKDWKR